MEMMIAKMLTTVHARAWVWRHGLVRGSQGKEATPCPSQRLRYEHPLSKIEVWISRPKDWGMNILSKRLRYEYPVPKIEVSTAKIWKFQIIKLTIFQKSGMGGMQHSQFVQYFIQKLPQRLRGYIWCQGGLIKPCDTLTAHQVSVQMKVLFNKQNVIFPSKYL